jgi:hypothetical protein
LMKYNMIFSFRDYVEREPPNGLRYPQVADNNTV